MIPLRIDREEMNKFMPQSDNMLLLNGIVDWRDDFEELTAVASVGADNPFLDDVEGTVSIVIGFEYMAQTAAALSGLERHLRGTSEPRPGYIIGIRGFKGHVSHIPYGIEFMINATLLFRDGPVVSFECRINADDIILAEGRINAYEPTGDGDTTGIIKT